MKRIMTILAAAAVSAVFSANVAAQSYEVKGVIEDSLGPVIGATVLEQGTTNGTITDIDRGNFLQRLYHPVFQGFCRAGKSNAE